jgi:hypothetical protein
MNFLDKIKDFLFPIKINWAEFRKNYTKTDWKLRDKLYKRLEMAINGKSGN